MAFREKNLHIVFLHDFNLYDMSNPQKGVEDMTSFKAIKSALGDKNPSDKTLVFFSGDVIGKEFNITSLQNASIENKKILFWGLQKRIDKLIDYLGYVAKNGADEIILMNGRDEHQAKRKLNRDILEDALMDSFNNVLLNYAVEKIPSENAVGSYSNVIFSSGLARYKDATKSYVPTVSTKGYNSFTLVLGDANHKVEIARTTNFTDPKTYAVERRIAKQQQEIQILADAAKKAIDEKLAKVYQNQPNYKKILDSEKGE